MKKILLMGAIGLSVFSFAQEKASLKQIYSLADDLKKSGSIYQQDSIISEMKKVRDNLGDFDKGLANTFINVSEQLINTKKLGVRSKDLSELSKSELKGFKIDEDKFKHTIFITNRWGFSIPVIQPYIAINDGNAFLRVKTQYNGFSWIFMDRVQLIIDGKDYFYEIPNTERNVLSGGKVKESSDYIADEKQIEILKAIVNSKDKISVRLSGQKYYDTIIDSGTKTKFKELLELFDKLKK
ncbi:hypothetical protein ACFO4P_17095 [Epilithonimonas pallida]|uniref:DUF4468 domain-containing protein n=1 Tax=Epilithonimonas pallida TaxID=373671 RepID=A0ABY1R3Z4_9FLAO|nr:hypothetical protein [Epilithonimonas pallida]SMP94705.1 hypothetical protein SAMN05421679_106104 [Epilithonimonas pallida]